MFRRVYCPAVYSKCQVEEEIFASNIAFNQIAFAQGP